MLAAFRINTLLRQEENFPETDETRKIIINREGKSEKKTAAKITFL